MRVLLAGLLIETGFLALAFLGDLRYHLPLLIAIYTGQFMLMLWAWSRREASSLPVLIFAILFRLTLFPTTPSLSDDIYRYGWDGRVQRAGWSPSKLAPSAPELSFLRDDAYELINHKNVPTIYPPLTQALFRSGSYLADGLRSAGLSAVRAAVFSQKAFFLLFDLLCIALIVVLLKERGLPFRHVLLYAWNPLVILEFAGSGHNDSLGIFFMVAGLLAWEQRRPVWATLGLAASFLSKYLTVLFVPYLIWKKKWRELAFGSVVVLAILIPVWFSRMLLRGVSTYAEHWQFNGSLFPLLMRVLRSMDRTKWTVAAAAGLFATVTGRREMDLARTGFLCVLATLLLAPTVYAWYFVWLIPFLCLFPHPAVLTWNATIILNYTVWHRLLHYHVWDLNPAIQLLEYVPVYALLFYPTLQLRLRRVPMC